MAGPSEILILAEEGANPAYAAADLLSQAEHDELASGILITPDKDLAAAVKSEVARQAALLSRRGIIEKSLAGYGGIITVADMDEGIEIANRIAPEHLEIMSESPFNILPKVKNAGAIFMGNYTPEPLGDYMAGPNHVLPTGGTSRFFSPLSVDDFVKKSSILSFSRNALMELADDVAYFAKTEGLTAHANAVEIRKIK